jgi:hypothetical protein
MLGLRIIFFQPSINLNHLKEGRRLLHPKEIETLKGVAALLSVSVGDSRTVVLVKPKRKPFTACSTQM